MLDLGLFIQTIGGWRGERGFWLIDRALAAYRLKSNR